MQTVLIDDEKLTLKQYLINLNSSKIINRGGKQND